MIYETSFEDPVGNRVQTAPVGWVLGLGYNAGAIGMENMNSGTFSTPYGSQAAILWDRDRSIRNTDSNTIEAALMAGFPYTVSFNVARNTDVSGEYVVQLVAYNPGEPRDGTTDSPGGSVLGQVSGTAIPPDMAAAATAFSFMADPGHADLGKLLGLRIRQIGTIDNLKLTWVPPPPAGSVLIIR